MGRTARSTRPPNTSPMHWWPRHTPKIGMRWPKAAITALLIPASLGVQGPGETMMCVGARASISPKEIASWRTTRRGWPSSPT